MAGGENLQNRLGHTVHAAERCFYRPCKSISVAYRRLRGRSINLRNQVSIRTTLQPSRRSARHGAIDKHADSLIEVSATSTTATQARYLFVFDRKVVIIGDLVAFVDRLLCVNDDLFAVTDREDTSCAVGRATMVDQSTEIPFHCCINDHIVVDAAAESRKSA